MEQKIILSLHDVKKIKYATDAIIVYTKDKVFICEKDSEKFLTDYIVEYSLKALNEKNN